MEQRSDEWFLERCGSLGGGTIGQALARLKRGSGDRGRGERTKAALDLMYELAAERVTGRPAKRVNALQWGLEHEDEARAAYAFLTNMPIVQVGLIPHPSIAHAHASPDALVGDEGGLEIKCPTSGVHLQTLTADAIPEEHLPQIFWNMACSGRAWWDFLSYDPRFPEGLQFFVKRAYRDEEVIALMEAEASAFLAEIDEKLARLNLREAA